MSGSAVGQCGSGSPQWCTNAASTCNSASPTEQRSSAGYVIGIIAYALLSQAGGRVIVMAMVIAGCVGAGEAAGDLEQMRRDTLPHYNDWAAGYVGVSATAATLYWEAALVAATILVEKACNTVDASLIRQSGRWFRTGEIRHLYLRHVMSDREGCDIPPKPPLEVVRKQRGKCPAQTMQGREAGECEGNDIFDCDYCYDKWSLAHRLDPVPSMMNSLHVTHGRLGV